MCLNVTLFEARFNYSSSASVGVHKSSSTISVELLLTALLLICSGYINTDIHTKFKLQPAVGTVVKVELIHFVLRHIWSL